MKKVSKILFFASLLFMGTVAITNAEKLADVPLTNPIKYATFSELVAGVTEKAVSVLMPFVVIAFIYAGFLFVRAQGKPEDLKKAKEVMFWSVIGAFILFGAWSFAQIIGTTVSTITNI